VSGNARQEGGTSPFALLPARPLRDIAKSIATEILVMKKLVVLVALSALSSCCADVVVAAEMAARSEPVAAASTRQVIGDWVIACTPVADARKSCMMFQTLASAKLKSVVSVFTIGKDRAGKLKASIRLPVGVALTAGVVVDIESQNSFTVPYSTCHRTGCFAPFDLTEPMLGQMRKATKISAAAQSVSKQAFNVNFSTRGFPAAYEAYLDQSR
jgi:invasion protein IalB